MKREKGGGEVLVSREHVFQVRIVVSDFQPQGQPGLNQKLQQIVRDLGEIDKLRYIEIYR